MRTLIRTFFMLGCVALLATGTIWADNDGDQVVRISDDHCNFDIDLDALQGGKETAADSEEAPCTFDVEGQVTDDLGNTLVSGFRILELDLPPAPIFFPTGDGSGGSSPAGANDRIIHFVFFVELRTGSQGEDDDDEEGERLFASVLLREIEGEAPVRELTVFEAGEDDGGCLSRSSTDDDDEDDGASCQELAAFIDRVQQETNLEPFIRETMGRLELLQLPVDIQIGTAPARLFLFSPDLACTDSAFNLMQFPEFDPRKLAPAAECGSLDEGRCSSDCTGGSTVGAGSPLTVAEDRDGSGRISNGDVVTNNESQTNFLVSGFDGNMVGGTFCLDPDVPPCDPQKQQCQDKPGGGA